MATGDSLIPNGAIDTFKLDKKATIIHSLVRSTDSDTNPSAPTWASSTPTSSLITNALTLTDEPTGNIVLVSYTSKNNPYIQTTPKPVIEVLPKVKASNSHSIYKGALVGNQVSGKIQVGNGANGYESKVLENITEYGYDTIVTANVPFNIVQGQVYAFQGFDNEAVNVVLSYRNGVSASNITYAPNAVSPLGDASWTVISTNRYIGVPSHTTIALDNANSPASKWFETLEEGNNGVLAGVYGQEVVYGADTGNFTNLSNGTTTDFSNNTVRTFHGAIPLNGKIK